MFDLKQLFSPDGACAAVLPGWRARPQQLAMAEAVERAVADNSVLLAEAGTGTGKTLAYLIPALLSGGKVVISTGTKALQDQLFHRDLPAARRALKSPVKVALLKGRANYVCHHHLQRNLADGRFTQRDDAAWLAKDTDLVSLQKDPRMKGISEGARANKEKKLAAEHPADAKLQHELLARVAEDQQARAAMVASQMKDPRASAAMKAVDTRNTAWMKTVIAAHGWPGVTLVGKTAAQGAWLLVQHADLDPAFQERCLPLLAKAVKAHEADGKNLAYLTDRVRLAAGKPQVYGTQFEPRAGKWVPKTLEDPAHVDARRKSMGLGTLAEYAEQMLHMYGPAPKGPPPTQKAPEAKKAAPGK